MATMRPGASASFGPVKQVNAGPLNVGYAEAGPVGGPAVMLLHGWPYDIHSFADVTPALASAGYRVIVPFVRGYGTTRFLSGDTPRNGQQAVLAADVIAHMDALGIDKAKPAAPSERWRSDRAGQDRQARNTVALNEQCEHYEVCSQVSA